MKIKKGDQIIVIAGKDKGQQGKVLSVVDKGYVIVEGINKYKKHQKPNPKTNAPGGIVEKEGRIHISNVALYNPNAKKAGKVGFKIQNDKKVRYFKSDNEIIDL